MEMFTSKPVKQFSRPGNQFNYAHEWDSEFLVVVVCMYVHINLFV